jgi:serine/threonine-protein phosphatase Stp1
MIIRHNAITHVGRVRKVNEDSILASDEHSIWVVADGMGGHAAGDYASQTIVDAVAMLPLDQEPVELMRSLRTTIMAAHDTIKAEAEIRGGATIGSAIVALMIAQDSFVAFWAGDCRLYLLRDDEIDLLTSDHSVVADLVHAGEMTWDEAEMHPQSNAITRAVGVGEELELDKIRGKILPGDRFLLCSDGLNKYAGFNVLCSAMRNTPIETVSGKLLNIALTGGGADNISAIVVDAI